MQRCWPHVRACCYRKGTKYVELVQCNSAGERMNVGESKLSRRLARSGVLHHTRPFQLHPTSPGRHVARFGARCFRRTRRTGQRPVKSEYSRCVDNASSATPRSEEARECKCRRRHHRWTSPCWPPCLLVTHRPWNCFSLPEPMLTVKRCVQPLRAATSMLCACFCI